MPLFLRDTHMHPCPLHTHNVHRKLFTARPFLWATWLCVRGRTPTNMPHAEMGRSTHAHVCAHTYTLKHTMTQPVHTRASHMGQSHVKRELVPMSEPDTLRAH